MAEGAGNVHDVDRRTRDARVQEVEVMFAPRRLTAVSAGLAAGHDPMVISALCSPLHPALIILIINRFLATRLPSSAANGCPLYSHSFRGHQSGCQTGAGSADLVLIAVLLAFPVLYIRLSPRSV